MKEKKNKQDETGHFSNGILWCTKRVKSTDAGRPVFQKYGSTRKFTGRPVFLRVDP